MIWSGVTVPEYVGSVDGFGDVAPPFGEGDDEADGAADDDGAADAEGWAVGDGDGEGFAAATAAAPPRINANTANKNATWRIVETSCSAVADMDRESAVVPIDPESCSEVARPPCSKPP